MKTLQQHNSSIQATKPNDGHFENMKMTTQYNLVSIKGGGEEVVRNMYYIEGFLKKIGCIN